jgi:aspartyl aminopeptidase
MISAATGATTVDVGTPTLSMHSARELAGVADQAYYVDLLTAFLTP